MDYPNNAIIMRQYEIRHTLSSGSICVRGPLTLRDIDVQFPNCDSLLHEVIDLKAGETVRIAETSILARIK